MNQVNPIDYVLAGCLRSIYALSSNHSSHSLTFSEIRNAFYGRYDTQLPENILEYAVKRAEHIGAFNAVIDPYAETLIEISDYEIQQFINNIDSAIIKRGWNNADWLSSVYRNPKFWNDVEIYSLGHETVEAVPSADGFVTVNHNSPEFAEGEALVVAADEAIRGDNEIVDNEQKSWIRVHIQAGIELVRRGGPILKAALLALIVEPLKAALKATANENVRKLVSAALTAILKWFV